MVPPAGAAILTNRRTQNACGAEQCVPASLDAHCQVVPVDHEAGDHQEQVDADAESGQGEAVSNACLEPVDQPDM